MLYFIEELFGPSFKFHLNLLFKSDKDKFSPSFCREITLNRKKISCYDDWNTFLHFVSVSVVETSVEYPGGWNICSFLTVFWKNMNYALQFFSDNGYIKKWYEFFFYVGFLSRTFTIHRTAGKGRGHFINSSLPLPPASQTLRH